MYLVVENISVTIPGDERSRMHPGHGYPESTETYQRVREYSTEEELQYFIDTLGRWDGRSIKIYEATKLELVTETKLVKARHA